MCLPYTSFPLVLASRFMKCLPMCFWTCPTQSSFSTLQSPYVFSAALYAYYPCHKPSICIWYCDVSQICSTKLWHPQLPSQVTYSKINVTLIRSKMLKLPLFKLLIALTMSLLHGTFVAFFWKNISSVHCYHKDRLQNSLSCSWNIVHDTKIIMRSKVPIIIIILKCQCI